MKQSKSMLWAEFRLAVIGRLLFSPLRYGELTTELNELSKRTWLNPEDRTQMRIGRSTIEKWYYKALGNPSDPLCCFMKDRSNKGSFPSVSRRADKILGRQTKRHPEWTVIKHFHALEKKLQGSPIESMPSYSSVGRYVRYHSTKNGSDSTPNQAKIARLAGLISHLRRVNIVKCVHIRLLENGCTRRRINANKMAWSRLGPSEKQYVLHALERYRRAGGTFLQFCASTNLSTASLERWFAAYRVDGLSGLTSRKPRHRKVITSKVKTKRLLEIFHSTPMTHGINRTSWTGDALARAYTVAWDETMAPETARRHIARCGYKYSRAKVVLTSSDPDYHKKLHRLLEILHSLSKSEALFFVDELGPVRVKRHGGRSYMRKDGIKKIPQKQPNKGSICLVGALCAQTNQMSWLYCNSKDSRAMIDITEILFNQYYRMRTLYLTWDAASWHSSNEYTAWLNSFNQDTVAQANGPIIELAPLPSNAQFLDVIESVFSAMKKSVIHNSDYQSPEEMKEAISRHFRERNVFFFKNPRRAGKKIWEVDFFKNVENIRAGNYREW